jgi:hypothetical protein
MTIKEEMKQRNKLRAEGRKLWVEGSKLQAESYKLRAEGDLLVINAVIKKHGPKAVIKFDGDKVAVTATAETTVTY